MAPHAVAESDLELTRSDGDTASRAVAIDKGFGSELLELHLARYAPGRSQPRTLEGVQEVMFAAEGSGALIVDGESHRLEPMTAAYVVAGETYEIDNPGPETLLVVSAVAPQSDGSATGRTVR
jgi:mannose-6-phosphate isomerase-like protein (cupin superfamily)